jgi:hypothetical protein
VVNRLKLLIVSFVSLFSMAAPLAMTAAVSAQDIRTDFCTGANSASGYNNACDAATVDGAEDPVRKLLRTIVKYISIVVGGVSIIMIIIGGFKYITSGGDSSNVTGAKNTILYAIVGLIIVALAQIIVRFVLTTADTANQ